MLGSVSLLRMPECEDTVPAFKELTAQWDDEDINRQLQNKQSTYKSVKRDIEEPYRKDLSGIIK